MRLHFAADHAGFEFKETLKEHFSQQGHEIIDHGADTYDAADNYPPMCIACAEAVKNDPGSLGFVLGGSGNGEQMAANLVPGIRAALTWSVETAELARQHNDAQIAAIGGRMHREEETIAIADAFVNTPFSGDQRHQNRINMMNDYQA